MKDSPPAVVAKAPAVEERHTRLNFVTRPQDRRDRSSNPLHVQLHDLGPAKVSEQNETEDPPFSLTPSVRFVNFANFVGLPPATTSCRGPAFQRNLEVKRGCSSAGWVDRFMWEPAEALATGGRLNH
jgi:hypothetical protein